MALYLSQMAAFGLVGFDPLGAIVMLAFIAGGARRIHAVVFTSVNWLTIVVVGTAAGSAVGIVLDPVRHWLSSVPRRIWVPVEIVAAIALVIWAIVRLHTGQAPEKQEKTRPVRLWLIIGIPAGLALSMLADPGFDGAVLAGASHPIWWQLIGLSLWYLIAMSALVVVCAAAILGETAPVSAWMRRWLSKSRRPVWIVVTALIVLVAVLLVMDAVLLATTGKFLPDLG